MPGGRPLKYSKKEEIEPLIELYFNECDEDGRPYTMSGLAYALNIDRTTLLRISGKDEFCSTIKKARERCERYAEERLMTANSVAGVIFNLKNNYAWTDKQEHEHSVSDNLKLEVNFVEPDEAES